MSEKPEDVFVVVDIETTGLDPNKESILEVGALAIDFKKLAILGPTFNAVVHYKRGAGAEIDPYVEEMHTVNGLWKACAESTCTRSEMFKALVLWMREYGGSHKNVVLVGNSVHFDRSFLTHAVHGSYDLTQLLHYRMVDVRSITYATEKWLPAVRPGDLEPAHRALPDAQYSLNMLRWLKGEMLLGEVR